jgi:hypothetical protein
VITDRIHLYESLKKVAGDVTIWASDVARDVEDIGNSSTVDTFKASVQDLIESISIESQSRASRISQPLLTLPRGSSSRARSIHGSSLFISELLGLY